MIMKSLKEYALILLADGKYFFSKMEAISALGLNENQFRLQAFRLYQKRGLKNLGHGFFMIIPPEYHHLGSLPPHWIVDPLMKYLNHDYYIGLLSAASLYGATEQQPMIFQVISDKQIRPIELERGGIEFHCREDCAFASKEQITVPTGYARISTKEQTLVDLVRFHPVCGHLSNVANIIQDLGESCKPEALAQVVKSEKMKSVLQRLGYILELVGFPELARVIEFELKQRRVHETLLRPDFYIKKGKRVNRWKLILNDTLEINE
jgi:predicted transcriptional regulator of viral defense system